MIALIVFLLLGFPFGDENAEGRFRRSSAAVRAFKRVTPCPATGKVEKACKGYKVDHIIALDCADSLKLSKRFLDVTRNMQWQPDAEAKAKDRWERQPEACSTLWRVHGPMLTREDVH